MICWTAPGAMKAKTSCQCFKLTTFHQVNRTQKTQTPQGGKTTTAPQKSNWLPLVSTGPGFFKITGRLTKNTWRGRMLPSILSGYENTGVLLTCAPFSLQHATISSRSWRAPLWCWTLANESLSIPLQGMDSHHILFTCKKRPFP